MIDSTFILSKLPPYIGNSKLLQSNQSVADIKKAIMQSFEHDKKHYAAIAPYFVGSTVYETCKNVFDFLRANVNNVTEGVELQTVKTPSAIIATGKTTGSDCKNYSLFVGGVLDAVNRSGLQKIPIAFRFCKYRQYDGSYLDHVFIVVYPNRKSEIWVDCISDVPYFNHKRLPDYFTDKKINSMALVRMSGVGADMSKDFAQKLQAEREKRIANGKLKVGSIQDQRYIKALAKMGVFDPTQLVAPINNNQLNQAISQSNAGSAHSWLDVFSGNNGANVSSIINNGLDVKSVIETGLNFVPFVGTALSSLVEPIINLFPSKGGLYADWSKDADGGLAEVNRWIKQDGNSPQQEATDAIRLMNERGWSNYIGQPTRYGDTPLTFQSVIDKLNRVGLQDVAIKLQQALQNAEAKSNTKVDDNKKDDSGGNKKLSPLVWAAIAFGTAKITKII